MVKPISLNNILFISIVKYLSICIHFKMLSRTSKKAFKFRIPMANNQTEYMIQWHLDEYMVFYNRSRTTRLAPEWIYIRQ